MKIKRERERDTYISRERGKDNERDIYAYRETERERNRRKTTEGETQKNRHRTQKRRKLGREGIQQGRRGRSGWRGREARPGDGAPWRG